MRLFILLTILFLTLAPQTLAHVVVKPNTVAAGSFQTFTTNVPNEKDNPTIGIRLVIPAGLKSISPNVKPGWTITIKKEGDSVTELEWTGGSIPTEQRDEFLFSAQAPTEETKLVWKAYQTYQDGTIVSWDHDSADSEHNDKMEGDKPHTPASKTLVIAEEGKIESHETPKSVVVNNSPTGFIPLVALAISVVALVASLRKR